LLTIFEHGASAYLFDLAAYY